jgi:hypothetical protein
MAYTSTGGIAARRTGYSPVGGIADVASVALKVTNDPYLPKVVSLISEIKSLSSDSSSSGPSEPGEGMRKIIKPLEFYVAYKKKPWLGPALIGGVILTIFSFGVATGRGARRGEP